MKHLLIRNWVTTYASQLAIILFGVVILFWKLGSVPHGMTVDEAAIGYNGQAVVATFRDEWLQLLPFSFRSFGDYKTPLAIYINGLFTAVFGMKLWVIRLPFALSGLLAIWGINHLMTQLYRYHHPLSSWSWWTPARAGLLASGLLITTPWFIHFARTGFESGMALMFLILGQAALITFFNHTGKKRTYTLWFAVGLLVAAMYTYHSAKVVVPLLTVFIGVAHWRRAKKQFQSLALASLLGVVLLAPMAYDTLLGEGATRFTQTTVFSEAANFDHLRSLLTKSVIAHLDPRFLVGGLTTTLRHGDGRWGVLLPVVFGLWLIGVGSIYFWRKNYGTRRLWLVGLAWTIIGLVPAMLGSEVPHSNRALLALPGFLLTVLLGLEYLATVIFFSRANRKIRGSHGEKDSVLKAVLGSLLIVHLFTFASYQYYYYTSFAARSAHDYLDGYIETYNFIIPYETGSAGREVERILFTNYYGQPYIYALVARKTKPIFYWGGSLIKYQFVDFENTSSLLRPNTVVVAAPEDGFPVEQATQVIYGSDGQPRFLIYVNQNE